MNVHHPQPNITALFDEAVKKRERLTAAERSALFMRIFNEPPVPHFSPGAEKIGLVDMRAYVYMRNSKGDYERSTSMIRQFAPVREFAAVRRFNIMGVFCDPDTSGRSLMDLPGLMNLVLLARQGFVDVINLALRRAGRVCHAAPVADELILADGSNGFKRSTTIGKFALSPGGSRPIAWTILWVREARDGVRR